MKCEQAELRMAELLAGEILPEDRAGLEKHLLDCAACRGDFELAQEGLGIQWADVSPPKEVIDATLALFREPAPVVRLLRWATAAAAVLGMAALLLTSSRATKAPVERAAEISVRRPEMLAMMQDAVVGALVCKDEDGRPVGELGLKSHDVSVEILDGIAKTTVEENFENHTSRRLEGTFNFPLPSDASVSRLALEVNGKIEEGTCLERDRAREVFESIVRRMQDPALLEWQPGGFFKCRVFPIEPHATKRVIVAYTQALSCFQGRMTYVYPMVSEKTRTHPPEEVKISLRARFGGALAKIESPSHRLDVQRKSAGEASMSFRAAHYRPNNDFVVTMEPGEEDVRVVSHKPDGEDGYFACFATPRGGGERTPGHYAFVLDVSASISAPRLEVAKRLVRAMLERRIAGDRFEILAHNVEVERSGEVDVRSANDFMDRLRPIGGSDVLKALLAAGDAEVIYIGKGAPSFGETDPAKILGAVKGRRIRTIAVGSDANGVLLEKLGGMMRVNPNDDVNKRVAEIAATLGSPVLSDVKVDGGEAVYDVVGVRDLFYGERLVVSGRYRGEKAKLAITGRAYRREVHVSFPLKEEGNNYVRRLWAQRKVADLLTEGAGKRQEVTELGVKYQIMTPYTSFLVLENEQMWKDHQLKREVHQQDQVLSVGDKSRILLEDATSLYKQGKYTEASAKFEEAFQTNPSSDQVYACIQRAGEGLIDRMMNDPESRVQDIGRRLMVLARPGEEAAREGRAAVTKVPKVEPPAPLPGVVSQARLPVEKPTPPPAAAPIPEDRQQRRSIETPDAEDPVIPKVKSAREGRSPAADRNSLGAGDATKQWRDVYTSPSFLERFNHMKRGDGGMADLPWIDIDPSEAALTLDPVAGLRFDFRKPTPGTSAGAPITDALPILEDIPILGYLFTPPLNEGPEQARREMETRVVQLKSVSPPGVYSAKVEPGRTLFGQPDTPPGASEDLLKRWELGKKVESQLTRDAAGRILGVMNFDPVTNAFVVRDTPEALERVSRIIAEADRSAAGPGPGEGFQQLLKVRGGEELPRIEGAQKGAAPAAREADAGTVPSQAFKVDADLQVYVRQLEVQLAQIQELTTKVDEHRSKLVKTLSEKSLVTAELGYARQQAERLQQDLSELEAKHVEMAREKKHLEERLNAIAQAGGDVNVAPRKPMEAKVTAVANEIGLVVISIGKDDGVLEGDEFTVNRGGDFVAKIVINRSDRKWSAGKVVLRKSDPRLADDVSNHVFVAAACANPSELTMSVEATTEDGSWVALKTGVSGAAPRQVFAVDRAGKFVALVRVTRVSETRIEAQVVQGLAVGRLLPGDRARFVADARAYLSTLPAEVRADLASRQSQQSIRAKMGMKE